MLVVSQNADNSHLEYLELRPPPSSTHSTTRRSHAMDSLHARQDAGAVSDTDGEEDTLLLSDSGASQISRGELKFLQRLHDRYNTWQWTEE